MSFSTLGLSPKLLKSIADAGYTEPTPIQLSAIPRVLAGHDLIGIAQTGTGKTAAFVLPLLERILSRPQGKTPRALILAPTRELALQIDEQVRILGRHYNVRCATIFGGVGESPQIAAMRRGVDVVVATPGRLLDLMNNRHVSLKDIEIAVFDEADRMLDMGFLPQIRRVVKELPRKRQTLLFSATLSSDIEKITNEFLTAPETVQIGRRADPASSVTQALYPVAKSRKADLLVHLLRDHNLDSVLVFSRTKHGADKIVRKLQAAKITSAALHSNRSQGQRVAALDAFKSGKVRVLVATDIASRGIDVEGISHVVNFDFPMHAEDYVHRIGRTGRADAIGDAISFVTPDDETSVRDLERMTKKTIGRKRLDDFDYTESAAAAPFFTRPKGQQQHAHQSRAGNSSRGSSASRGGASRTTSSRTTSSRTTSSRPASSSRPAHGPSSTPASRTQSRRRP